jgi:hypothetical protein
MSKIGLENQPIYLPYKTPQPNKTYPFYPRLVNNSNIKFFKEEIKNFMLIAPCIVI